MRDVRVKTVFHVTYVCVRVPGSRVPCPRCAVLAVWVESAFLFPDTNLERVSFVFNRNGFNDIRSAVSVSVRAKGTRRGRNDKGTPATATGTAAPGRAKAEAQPQAEA